MPAFDELFIDSETFRPPSKWQARASHLLVWMMIAILLIAGWFLKDWTLTQFRYVALAPGEPTIPYPAQWQPQSAGDWALLAIAPEDNSVYPAREAIAVLPLPETSFVTAWPAQRQRSLKAYHELAQTLSSLPDGRPALLLTYTYVIDAPETATTAPLTVVQAQDLVFVVDDGQSQRLVVVTLAATVPSWEHWQPLFQRIWQAMGIGR